MSKQRRVRTGVVLISSKSAFNLINLAAFCKTLKFTVLYITHSLDRVLQTNEHFGFILP